MSDVEITRDVDASARDVWRALTTAQLADWLWPPRFETRVDIDFRLGGGYRIQSDAQALAVSGRFTTIEDRVGYTETWKWDGEEGESLVRVSLIESGERVTLTIVHSDLADGEAADHDKGWNDCLDRLETYLKR